MTYDFSDPMARLGTLKTPLSPNPDVSEFIRVSAAIRDLKIKYPKTSEDILAVSAEAASMRALQIELTELLRRLLLKYQPHSDPCVCGSGRKFRKCCRPKMLSEPVN